MTTGVIGTVIGGTEPIDGEDPVGTATGPGDERTGARDTPGLSVEAAMGMLGPTANAVGERDAGTMGTPALAADVADGEDGDGDCGKASAIAGKMAGCARTAGARAGASGGDNGAATAGTPCVELEPARRGGPIEAGAEPISNRKSKSSLLGGV